LLQLSTPLVPLWRAFAASLKKKGAFGTIKI